MKVKITFILYLFFFISNAQNYEDALKKAENHYQQSTPNKIIEELKTIDSLKLKPTQKGRFYLHYSRYFDSQGDFEKSFDYAYRARFYAKKNKNIQTEFEALDVILSCYIDGVGRKELLETWINDLCLLSQQLTPKEKALCSYYQMINHILKGENAKALVVAKNGLEYSKKYRLKNREFDFTANATRIYENNKQLDSALILHKQAIANVNRDNDADLLFILYLNIASFYDRNSEQFKDSYEKSEIYYDKAFNLGLQTGHEREVQTYYLNRAISYVGKGNYERATKEYENYINLNKKLENKAFEDKVTELETKYRTEKKEIENKDLKVKNRARLVAISGLIIGIVMLLITSGLVIKNLNKKRKIALQEKLLAKAASDKILKEQELATLDAMIAGQEKERRKIASDLHDNIGSTLTAVRLYFDNIKTNTTDTNGFELYDKTDSLLKEAYEQIRSMSHLQNSGIYASKGLLPAVENLARTISQSGKIKLEVSHNNGPELLDSNLELSIFRIIQELITNAIKHANASHIYINLTRYSESMNIMIEDDGTGFDPKIVSRKEGMGLHSIEQRIEHLDGVMEIDAAPGRGTTISLDIPTLPTT